MVTAVDDEDDLFSYDSPPKRTARSTATRTGGGAGARAYDAAELLEFYRQRCEQFQSERKLMLDQMANVEVSKEELHRVKWDLKMSQQEVATLQASLREANAAIFQLKQEKLALEATNETLRVKEQDDRRKIQQLLVLTQTVTEEVVLARDTRPGTTVSYPLRPGAVTYPYPSTMHLGSEEMLPKKKRDTVAVAYSASRRSSVASTSKESERYTDQRRSSSATNTSVLRTVYMPGDQADSLAKTTSHWQQQLEKQQQLHSERVQQLLDEFADEKLHLQQQVDRSRDATESLEKQLEKAQRLLQKTTKDYLVLRHQSQEAERSTREELLSMAQQCEGLVNERSQAAQEAMAEADATKEKAQEESELYTQQLRDQALSRERDVLILREQYAALQEACAKRIHDLQTRLSNLRSRYRSLDQRRAMEMEGFTNDIAAVKRSVQRLETALYGRRVRQQQQQLAGRVENTRRIVQDNSQSTDLNDELAALQQRVAQLAAEVDSAST